MQLPYTEVGPGIFRPLAPVIIRGPIQQIWVDGLLDTGADRTLLPLHWAHRLGIDVKALTTEVTLRSVTGQSFSCKLVHLPFEIVRGATRIHWLAEVAISGSTIVDPHWGHKGFLEYFRAEFDGPNRIVTLTPGGNLPAVAAPP